MTPQSSWRSASLPGQEELIELVPRGDAELLKDAAQMGFNRARAQEQLRANIPVGSAATTNRNTCVSAGTLPERR